MIGDTVCGFHQGHFYDSFSKANFNTLDAKLARGVVMIFMLNDRSAKVGLEFEGMRERKNPRMQEETLAGNGIVMVRAGSTARVEGWITYRLRDKARAATEGCHDPEPILTDFLSHGSHAHIEMCRQVLSLRLITSGDLCSVLTCT